MNEDPREPGSFCSLLPSSPSAPSWQFFRNPQLTWSSETGRVKPGKEAESWLLTFPSRPVPHHTGASRYDFFFLLPTATKP
ncbi:rCG57807 [Rattus norvegicus]|uniref:RCG57807 n=1 Tax=Rattus norvegicus TaxID=10116 RepID=A6JHI1_RAT|nr:rCG57807 [Rattus norvegicus]